MGDLLFNRKVKVTIATRVSEDFRAVVADVIEIENLRVQFKVKKTNTKEPNTAEVTITNLSASRRASLQQKGVKFILQAGYEGAGIGQLFIGDARTIDHVRDGGSWHTTIKSGDGERAFRYARVSESFKAGTPIASVVRKIAQASGHGLGNLEQQLGSMTGQYVNGYAAHGVASKELEKSLKAAGFEFSVQDEQLLVLRPEQFGTVQVPDLGPDTGLIGSPEYGAPDKNKGKPVIKVRSLLNSIIKPGGQVVLRSARHKGPVHVHEVEHSGDTDGGDWYSDFQARPI